MKTTASTFRNVSCFLTLLALSVFLAACGSGGGTSSNPSGIASVNVSLAAAPGFPAGTVFTASPAAVEETAKPVSPVFDNVFVNIVKVALLPADGGAGPDPNGETMGPDDERDRGNGFVTAIVDPPRTIDLLHLPSGRKIARFLDNFVNVPAGTYGKIRVYYSDLWGVRGADVIPFHPTANSHFDVHFVNGNLVIPVTPDPEGGIRLYDVTIHFVGLKIVENKNKVLMRPQVFATVGDVQYVVSGIADNVDKTLGTFDVSTSGGLSFHALFDIDTKWAFKDNETLQQVAIDNNLLGIAALRDGSLVDVYGIFTGIDTLSTDNVVIIFTDAISGLVAPGDAPPSGWKSGDTFELSFPGDNVVIPMPSRTEARYDNNANLAQTFTDNVITQGTSVRARGYFSLGVEIEAFWISVGGP